MLEKMGFHILRFGGNMGSDEKRRVSLSEENIRAINLVLAMGHRVEVIPTKDSVRVIHIQREEVREHRSSL